MTVRPMFIGSFGQVAIADEKLKSRRFFIINHTIRRKETKVTMWN